MKGFEKIRAVRLPVTSEVADRMLKQLPSWADIESNSLISGVDIVMQWIKCCKTNWAYRGESKSKPHLMATECDNGKLYLDFVFDCHEVNEVVSFGKCRPLSRNEEYQMRLTGIYEDDLFENLRIIEYQWDPTDSFPFDCYTAVIDPFDFYSVQKMIEYSAMDQSLVETVEGSALVDFFDDIEELGSDNAMKIYASQLSKHKFYINRQEGVVLWKHFKKEDADMYTFVINKLSFKQILDLYQIRFHDTFFAMLEDVAEKQSMCFADDEFIDAIYNFMVEVPDFVGLTRSTMRALVETAKKYSK